MTRLFSFLLFSYQQLALDNGNTVNHRTVFNALDHRGSGRLSLETSSAIDHRGSGRLQFQGQSQKLSLTNMSWQLA